MTSDVAESPTAPGPIEKYAMLSDTRTAALVDDTGSVDWLCLPRFDSPSVFARLLGDEEHGRWQLVPTTTNYRVQRSYRENTLVLDTEFHTDTGSVRLTDSMLPHHADDTDHPALARSVEGLSGTVELRMRWVLRPAYGSSLPWVRRRRTDSEYILALAGPTTVTLHGDMLPDPIPGERKHEAVLTVAAGERFSWTMTYAPTPDDPVPTPDPAEDLVGTERFWREWSGRINYTGPGPEAVRRSLIVLK